MGVVDKVNQAKELLESSQVNYSRATNKYLKAQNEGLNVYFEEIRNRYHSSSLEGKKEIYNALEIIASDQVKSVENVESVNPIKNVRNYVGKKKAIKKRSTKKSFKKKLSRKFSKARAKRIRGELSVPKFIETKVGLKVDSSKTSALYQIEAGKYKPRNPPKPGSFSANLLKAYHEHGNYDPFGLYQ